MKLLIAAAAVVVLATMSSAQVLPGHSFAIGYLNGLGYGISDQLWYYSIFTADCFKALDSVYKIAADGQDERIAGINAFLAMVRAAPYHQYAGSEWASMKTITDSTMRDPVFFFYRAKECHRQKQIEPFEVIRDAARLLREKQYYAAGLHFGQAIKCINTASS